MYPEGGAGTVDGRRGITRRESLAVLGTAAALAAEPPGFLKRLLGGEDPSGVFRGDAPSGSVWEAWERRGWVREARHYRRSGRTVQCFTCPNGCVLEPGDRGHCRNRVNRGGVLYTLAYADPCALHIDPVEKKPLFHFLPGTQAFSMAASGCVFRCLNCQNWEISQKKPEETKDPRGPEVRGTPSRLAALGPGDLARLTLTPEDAARAAKAFGCPSVAYTYSEPTAWFEYMADTCVQARALGLRNIWVSCGSITREALLDLVPHLDAAHVDLKSFNPDVYRRLNSGALQPVLDTLCALKAHGVWFEVINLMVPTWTDDLDLVRRMCGWIAEHLGPDQVLHFSRFHPDYRLQDLPQTPLETLLKAREAARSAGLRYVYLGNAREIPDAGTTWCPGCRRALIERDLFSVRRNDVRAGRCRHCGARIAGVWS